MSLGEFDIIRRYFSDIGFAAEIDSAAATSNAQQHAIELGVGDDCAILQLPPGERLALSIDTLVADVHFPATATAFDIATRALATAVSDLAAMGARPLAFTLALTLPQPDELWLLDFSDGLRESAARYRVALIGGDTTRGPLTITVQVHGSLRTGGLRRSGAQVGDGVFVSGTLGDAAAALAVLQGRLSAQPEQAHFLHERFYRPTARVVLGEALLGVATAAIDISDGLLADLGHVLRASAVGAECVLSRLPMSEALLAVTTREQAQQWAQSGGDDYELCFTAPLSAREHLRELAEMLDVPITEIGLITEGDALLCRDASGAIVTPAQSGYQHFSGAAH